MRLLKALLFTLPVLTLGLTRANDAAACGACIVQQSESTQVTGHKMILSVSQEKTTLWDQISYSGNPSSFAWVLPIKGTVDVGISSDALFQLLDDTTKVTVRSPLIQCSPPPLCDDAYGGAVPLPEASPPSGPSVEVLAQEVVGPYETVQLKSEDPTALQTWLASHNYTIPKDLQPVIDAYVAEASTSSPSSSCPGRASRPCAPSA